MDSTNDEAARRLAAGAPVRTAVLADRQRRGRGRGGRTFASPPGGLYVSLLVALRAEDVPGPAIAALAVASAEAIEAVGGPPCALKWPNDLWIDRRKVGGWLLERAGEDAPAVAGLGVNLARVPADLPPDVAAETTCLETVAGRPVASLDLLAALLPRVDRRLDDLGDPARRAALEAAWRGRMLLVGEPVTFHLEGVPGRGVLRDVDLARGLLLETGRGGAATWHRGEHVRDLRPARASS